MTGEVATGNRVVNQSVNLGADLPAVPFVDPPARERKEETPTPNPPSESQAAERRFSREKASPLGRRLADYLATATLSEKVRVVVMDRLSLSSVRGALEQHGIYKGDISDDLNADWAGDINAIGELSDDERFVLELTGLLEAECCT